MALQTMLRHQGRALQTLALSRPTRFVCGQCLVRSFRSATSVGLVKPHRKRTSVVPVPSLLQSMRPLFIYQPDQVEPADPLLEEFRLELLENPVVPLSHAKRSIARRDRRKRLSSLYQRIRNQPAVFAELTDEDFDALITSFIPKERSKRVAGAMLKAVRFLQDRRARAGLCKAQFTVREAELLLSLYMELNQPVKCQALMMDIVRMSRVPSADAYHTVITQAARDTRMGMAMNWLEDMKEDGYWPPPILLTGSLVDSWLRLGKPEQAIALIQQQLAALSEHTESINEEMDNKALLEESLDVFIRENIMHLRLADATQLYQHKRDLGSTMNHKLTHLFIRKCLYTYQYDAADALLNVAMTTQDQATALLIGQLMIKYHASRKNLRRAVDIVYTLEDSGVRLTASDYTALIIRTARARYHVDLLRLYRRFKLLYPSVMFPNGYAKTMLGLVRCKQYGAVLEVLQDMKNHLSAEKMPNKAFRALYSLCAQTGDIAFFRELLDLQQLTRVRISHRTLTSLTSCYLAAGDVESAKAVFETIASSTRHGPDVVDFNLLLRAASMEGRAIDRVKIMEVLRHMNLMGVPPAPSTFRTLIEFYRESPVEETLYENALNYPDATRSDHVWINNIRLTRMLTTHHPAMVVDVFLKNDRSALFSSAEGESIEADGMTYKLLFDAIVKKPSLLETSQRLLDSMRSRGLKPEREVYTRILKGWTLQGSIEHIEEMKAIIQKDLGSAASSSAGAIRVPRMGDEHEEEDEEDSYGDDGDDGDDDDDDDDDDDCFFEETSDLDTHSSSWEDSSGPDSKT